MLRRFALTIVALFLSFPFAARADEGMWLFNQFPKPLVAGKYRLK